MWVIKCPAQEPNPLVCFCLVDLRIFSFSWKNSALKIILPICMTEWKVINVYLRIHHLIELRYILLSCLHGRADDLANKVDCELCGLRPSVIVPTNSIGKPLVKVKGFGYDPGPCPLLFSLNSKKLACISLPISLFELKNNKIIDYIANAFGYISFLFECKSVCRNVYLSI